MVTLQILVLPFLVRVRVPQQIYLAFSCPGRVEVLKSIGVWCNGNTADSGPAFSGSSPDTPTQKSSTSRNVCAALFLRGIKMQRLWVSRCSKLFYTISRCHFHIESTFSRRICPLRLRSHSPLCSLTRREHLRPDNALSM